MKTIGAQYVPGIPRSTVTYVTSSRDRSHCPWAPVPRTVQRGLVLHRPHIAESRGSRAAIQTLRRKEWTRLA